ncbi:MAG: hypothetical protein SWZ49_24225 [Cyanobacteriota bacterium]|nr:hypothetical protein [Cyanobacteriota bacterium]
MTVLSLLPLNKYLPSGLKTIELTLVFPVVEEVITSSDMGL